MLHEKTLLLYRTLEDGLHEIIKNQQYDLNTLARSIDFARIKLKELDACITENPLKDRQDEILYFKKIQPMFYAQLIYYLGYYNLEKGAQLIPFSELSTFFAEEERYIARFFHQNHFLYEYYQLGSTELDNLYFSALSDSLILPQFPFLDCPGATQVFSGFMAYEKLKKLVQMKKENMLNNNLPINASPDNPAQLKWTGDTINLVELAYGLYLTGQIGHGNVSLNRIVHWLEVNLQVELVHVSRRFTEISRRKRLSNTRFIDQMRLAVQQKVDDDSN